MLFVHLKSRLTPDKYTPYNFFYSFFLIFFTKFNKQHYNFFILFLIFFTKFNKQHAFIARCRIQCLDLVVQKTFPKGLKSNYFIVKEGFFLLIRTPSRWETCVFYFFFSLLWCNVYFTSITVEFTLLLLPPNIIGYFTCILNVSYLNIFCLYKIFLLDSQWVQLAFIENVFML